MTLLSFIIPVYNGEKYLDQAVNSILSQPEKDYEIIIIDDGSTDASGAIADVYALKDERIHAIHTKNAGVSHARNIGIEQATGLYLAFLDSDDMICKNVYTEELVGILQSEQYDVISFAYINADGEMTRGNICGNAKGIVNSGDDNFYKSIFGKHPCSNIYKRSAIGDVRYPVGIRYNEDLTFVILLIENCRTVLSTDKCWFLYRRNFSSAIHKSNVAERTITDEISAWDWCRGQCKTENFANICSSQIFILGVDYIKYASNECEKWFIIKKKLEQNTAFQSVVHNTAIWKRNVEETLYADFVSNPKQCCKKLRLKNLPYRIGKTVITWPVLTQISTRIRYKKDIKEYVG